jgi:hypothetical protein
MRHGHGIAIDGIARDGSGRGEVDDKLVAEEIEIDPAVRAAAFGAAEDCAVEMPGGGEICDGDGRGEAGDLRVD